MAEKEPEEHYNYVYISFAYLDEVETLRSENSEIRTRKIAVADNGRPVKSWKVIENDAGVRLYGYLGTKRKGENVAAESLVISPKAGYSLKYDDYLDYDEKCYTTENLIPLGLKKFTDAAITKKMINFGLFDKHIEKKEEYNEKITDIQEELNNILKYI